MDITRVIPGPVSVRLAGKNWMAGELTLADYAELQGWANSLEPQPFDEAASTLERDETPGAVEAPAPRPRTARDRDGCRRPANA